MLRKSLALAILFTLPAAAGTAQDVAAGAALFARHCAVCHGPAATGNGPLAELIAIETPDLTRLSAQGDGTFPVARVAGQIDGRASLRAHGGDMPMFGAFFTGEDVSIGTETGQPMLTSKPIADLIAWLETVQR